MTDKLMKEMFHLSFKEEVGNVISHGVMAIIMLLLLPFAAVYSYITSGVLKSICVSIYVICLFIMFLMSTFYHSMAYDSTQKYVMRKLDYICIFLAIAGSYTPIVLCLTKGWLRIMILLMQWGAVVFGILLKAIAKKSYPIFTTVIYLLMGWCALLFLPTLIHSSTPLFLFFIVLGGLFYSGGIFFFAKPQIKFFHFVWHLFINCASICHFIAIVFLM